MAPTEPPFLQLPTEIRQEILNLSLSDEDILNSIELRASQSRDNIWQTNVWEVKWSCGVFEKPMANGTRLPPPSWWLNLDLEIFSKDKKWVQQTWLARIPALGDKKQKAWEDVFGKR
jgi:hypothetical protein